MTKHLNNRQYKNLLKLILNFFSGAPKLPLILNVSLSHDIKKLFLRLSVWDDELLSTPKIITFLAYTLPKFHSPFSPNASP